MKVTLQFDVDIEWHNTDVDDLGRDLAVFLRESFFNGEDVCDVRYTGNKLNKK